MNATFRSTAAASLRLFVLLVLSSRAFSEGPARVGHDTHATLAARPGPSPDARDDSIVHVPRALTDADRAELAAKGIEIRHALPGNRYLARGSASDERIATIEPLTAEKKIHPSAWRAAKLHVVFHQDVTFDEARAAILAAGGALDVFTTRFLPSQRIDVLLPPSSLEALASDARVLAVAGARRFRITSDNAASAALAHVSELFAAPYGLSGSGVAVSLFELGEAQASHAEFGGRLHVAPTTLGGAGGARRHATHVAGTIGAAGLRTDAKGMAPGATIHQFCVPDPQGTNACTGEWLALKDEQLAPLGIVADNNSWSFILGWRDAETPVWHGYDQYWGAYDLREGAPLDRISAERNVLFVQSAGNDGALPVPLRFDPFQRHLHVDAAGEDVPGQYFCVTRDGSGSDCPSACNAGCETVKHHPQLPFDTISVTGSAKNVITVGAVNSNPAIATFSSRGPAKDGRVKPEVVARGVNVLSTEPTDRYGTTSGTSMAAPVVTGIAALLAEQWRRSHFGATPTPAHLKALLIAGADDIGNPGPDYTFGFGLVNAKKSIDFIVQDRVRTVSVAQNETREIEVVVDEAQPLRIVLNWADPAIPYLGGDDIAAKALINDLDVKVVDPAGHTILPWTLNRDAVNAHAVRGVNVVDPTERIDLASAGPGIYRIVITGTNVMEGPQTAVLVTSARVRAEKQMPKRRAMR